MKIWTPSSLSCIFLLYFVRLNIVEGVKYKNFFLMVKTSFNINDLWDNKGKKNTFFQ